MHSKLIGFFSWGALFFLYGIFQSDSGGMFLTMILAFFVCIGLVILIHRSEERKEKELKKDDKISRPSIEKKGISNIPGTDNSSTKIRTERNNDNKKTGSSPLIVYTHEINDTILTKEKTLKTQSSVPKTTISHDKNSKSAIVAVRKIIGDYNQIPIGQQKTKENKLLNDIKTELTNGNYDFTEEQMNVIWEIIPTTLEEWAVINLFSKNGFELNGSNKVRRIIPHSEKSILSPITSTPSLKKTGITQEQIMFLENNKIYEKLGFTSFEIPDNIDELFAIDSLIDLINKLQLKIFFGGSENSSCSYIILSFGAYPFYTIEDYANSVPEAIRLLKREPKPDNEDWDSYNSRRENAQKLLLKNVDLLLEGLKQCSIFGKDNYVMPSSRHLINKIFRNIGMKMDFIEVDSKKQIECGTFAESCDNARIKMQFTEHSQPGINCTIVDDILGWGGSLLHVNRNIGRKPNLFIFFAHDKKHR